MCGKGGVAATVAEFSGEARPGPYDVVGRTQLSPTAQHNSPAQTSTPCHHDYTLAHGLVAGPTDYLAPLRTTS